MSKNDIIVGILSWDHRHFNWKTVASERNELNTEQAPQVVGISLTAFMSAINGNSRGLLQVHPQIFSDTEYKHYLNW